MYMWSFGNGSDPVTVTGLQNAAVVMKSFHAIGHYNVTVVAVNRKGRAEAVLPIHVEGMVQFIYQLSFLLNEIFHIYYC